jgi:PAS domain S-box-containing protein
MIKGLINKFKIRTRLILVLIVVSLIPFVTIGIVAIDISKKAMLDKIFAQLESVRDSKRAQIERYFTKIQSDISVLANSSHIGAALDAFSSTQFNGTIDEGQYDYFASLEYGESFAKFCQEYGYHDMLLITKNGDIVYSLKKEPDLAQNVFKNPLKSTQLGEYFSSGMKSIIMTDFELYSPSGNSPTAFLFSPIEIFGEVEGAVVLKLSIDSISNIMTERSGMGETGKAYLVGADKLMRSNSYLKPLTHSVTASFNNPKVGNVDTEASQGALDFETDKKIIRDFRGVTVLSAFVPISTEATTYALIAEIDETEAFKAINDLRNLIVFSAIVVLVLVILISVFMADRFTKPLIWLSESSKKIAEGQFDINIKYSAEDEIGILAKSFNKMQQAIKDTIDKLDSEIEEKNQAEQKLYNSNTELEQRVKDRTSDLEKIEKRFRDLLESAPDSMIIVNELGIINIINAQTEKLFGYQRDELIGQKIEFVVPERFRAEHPAKRDHFMQEALSRPRNAKLDLIGLNKNGNEFPVEVSLSPLKTDEGLLVSAAVRDISERVAAEEALRESEEKNRLVLENIGEGIFGVNLEGQVIFINPAACSILGYQNDELLGKPIHDIIHHTQKNGSSYPVEECPMRKAYTTGQTFHINDEILWKKNGSHIDVIYTSTPIVKGNDIVGAVITFSDVSDQRIAEEELKASQVRFRAYFEQSQVGMAVTHPNRGWLEVNKRLTDIFGYEFEELKQLGWEKLTHPDDIEEDTNKYQKMIDGEFDTYTMNKRMQRKNGKTVHINLSVSCLRNSDGDVDRVLASMMDITVAKTVEEELNQRLDDLNRFRKMAIGRENKMIELKKEINDLLDQSGLELKYKIQSK